MLNITQSLIGQCKRVKTTIGNWFVAITRRYVKQDAQPNALIKESKKNDYISTLEPQKFRKDQQTSSQLPSSMLLKFGGTFRP